MKAFLTAMNMCIGMFSVFYLPVRKWDDSLRKLSTACLPILGMIIGAAWWGGACLARALFPQPMAAALTAAIPFVLTGFMHLDGYMDTSDSLLSWRSREERIKILKDVHTGAFSVVMLALAMMLAYAACASADRLFPLMMIPVISRCGSAWSVLRLKPIGHSEYAAEGLKENRHCESAVVAMAVAALFVLMIAEGFAGLVTGLSVIAAYAVSMYICIKNLGGVSGDLAGFSLTVSEIVGLIVLSAM